MLLASIGFMLYCRQLVHIVSETNRKVLTVDGSESKPGARVVVRAASESPSMYQLWYEDESGIIRSALNDYALEGRCKSEVQS